ncbi:MAG: thioredoxin domain-containing protein [Chloroflexi bacterium]|nr:thioredoxin domain-containing protein [Chloroflexota bacterium]
MYLEDTYGEEFGSVYRHFPLSFHEHAIITGEATEAAGAQGKFWEMHDLLYDRQSEWNGLSSDDIPAKLVEYAGQLGLDTEQFARDLEEHIYRDKVVADGETAQAARLPGTPSYIINGVLYPTDELGLHPALVDAFIRVMQLQPRVHTDIPPQVIDPDRQYTATIRTDKGDIVIELYAEQAPVTVNSFAFLAQDGWYDGVTFFRVVPGFVAQTGDPTNTGLGRPGYQCDDETSPDLRFDAPGVVGMASAGPGTSTVGSQFFITYAPLPDLDGNYTVIGRVVEGLDVVESLTARDPGQNPDLPPGDTIETVIIEEM